MSRKLTLKESEWFWALNRGNVVKYYKKNYTYYPRDLSDDQYHLIIGGIVKHLICANNYLAVKVLKNMIIDWNINVYSAFNCDITNTSRIELNQHGLFWLLFNSLYASVMVSEYDEIFESGWRERWDKLDKEFSKPLKAKKNKK